MAICECGYEECKEYFDGTYNCPVCKSLINPTEENRLLNYLKKNISIKIYRNHYDIDIQLFYGKYEIGYDHVYVGDMINE